MINHTSRQRLFLMLAQLLRSGTPLPAAAEKVSRVGVGGVRKAALKLHQALTKGATAGEAFGNLSPELGQMERVTLSAAARTGRLDATLQRLADYFAFLVRIRGEMISHLLYPLFIFHLGVLLISLPKLVTEDGGLEPYLREVGSLLAWPWGIAALLALLIPILQNAAASSAGLDLLLRSLPAIGRARRDLAVGRFFGTYDMQLDAGVNVIDSLEASAAASHSGLIHKAVAHAVEGVRRGESVAPLLAETRSALPADAVGSLMIAEESGELHRTLPRLQEEYDRDGLNRLRTISEWVPRLVYLAAAGFVGWKVISFYQGYLGQLDAIGM